MIKKSCALLFFAIILLSACSGSKEKQPATMDFCSLIHFDKPVGLSSKLDPLRSLMSAKTGVFPLEHGDGSMISRAWLCENAERTIDVQYFIFTADNVGLIAVDYLVRAADRGVKVRILVDDIMVDSDEEKLLTLDAHKNISIKIYNPGTNVGKNIADKIINLKYDFRGSNQRMHNKTFTVDGDVVITGGRNIADEYFDYDHEYNFRDRDVLLIGGCVKDIQASFAQFWNSPLSREVTLLTDKSDYKIDVASKFEQLHQYACDSNNFWPQVRENIKQIPFVFDKIIKSGELQWLDSVVFVSDVPGKNNGKEGLGGGGNTTTALIELVKNAKKSIVIQSPYLITTKIGKNLFRDAVNRGVKVTIMTNSLSSTDNLEAFSGYQRDRDELLQTGVRIFEYRPDASIRKNIMTGGLQKKLDYTPVFGLHAKGMVIDSSITVIGTFNLDPRSANLNTECITIIHSAIISRGVMQGIEEELKPENSWETTLKFNPDDYAGYKKNMKVMTRRIVPKDIL